MRLMNNSQSNLGSISETVSPMKPKPALKHALSLLTFIVCVLSLPFLIFRSLLALMTTGRMFERKKIYNTNGHSFNLLAFAGQYSGRHWARLINLCRGELHWLGSRPGETNRSNIPPGLFSSADMRKRSGIITDDQEEHKYIEPPADLRTYLVLLARTIFVSWFTGKRIKPKPDQITLFGVPVSNCDLNEALNWIFSRVESGEKAIVPFVNAHCFNVACSNPEYQKILRQATRILPDGSGVRLACNFHGFSLKANLNGTDLFPHLCQEAAKKDLSLFLLGAAPGVAENVAAKMTERYPELQIAGTHHGFFKNEEEAEVIEKINRSGAQLLLVAMGVPQQEMWLARNIDKLNTIVNLGVGGLFDFYSERVSRAPVWLREIGMEWVWRLLQEPKRMWQRYIVGNPQFLLRAWRDSRRHSAQYLINKRGSAPVRRLRWWLGTRVNELGKRFLDITGSTLLLLFLSPLLLITTTLIKLESPGPVLFSQIRIGLRGKPFKLLKFRSMYINAENHLSALQTQNEMEGGVLFKMKNDPRITRIGRFIRRYSIDELPQLWNVLWGDMSLVGPRPALPSEVSQYSLADRQRLKASPGITCTWQVSGRSCIPFDRQVSMDVDYIHDATLGKDIQLLIKTIPAVFTGRGAY